VPDADGSVIAARLHGPRHVRVAREAAPEPGPDEVRVHVGAVGLCGSDLHWFEEGEIGDARLARPLVLGHEIAGRLDDGTLVVLDPNVPCGTCRECTSDRAHLCLVARFAGHGTTDGGLRSVIAWPGDLVRAVSPPIGDDAAALLEPLGIALHAVDLAAPRPGERAAVLGCGPIGLLTVQVLRAAGVDEVLVHDPLRHRLAAAVALGGADLAARPGVDADLVIEAAGTDDAVAAALDLVRPGGRVVLVGIPAGDRTSFRASVARRKEVTLVECRRMRSEDLDRAIRMAAAGRVELESLISHRFPLEDAAAAFEVLATRAGLKVLVRP
jgi:L-iditol 2-dehydrogenase